MSAPAADDAARIAEQVAGEAVRALERFGLGLANYVYDVELASGRRVVVRMGAEGTDATFGGAVRWSAKLRPLGVPLPELLASGRRGVFPWLLLERLPGRDLGLVYTTLSRVERRALALRIVELQGLVGSLPEGRGFGYASDPDAPFAFASWTELVRASLARSRRRIARAGVVPGDPVGEIERAAARLEPYLGSVRPRAFLDDTTTKNVIVEAGRLSGIVDVDVVCYGDPLFPLALTRTALANEGYAADYTDAWREALALDPAQERALAFYGALFGADLLSEYGSSFNRTAPLAPDPLRIERLRTFLAGQLARLA